MSDSSGGGDGAWNRGNKSVGSDPKAVFSSTPLQRELDPETHGMPDNVTPLDIGLPWWATRDGRREMARRRFSKEDPAYKSWDVEDMKATELGRWRVARTIAVTPSTQACGLSALPGVTATVTHGLGLGNVMTCGSPWACPHCSLRLARQRQGWAVRVAEGARKAGAIPRMVLLTMRHHAGEALGGLVDKALAGWREMMSSSRGRRERKRSGMLGAIRGLEVTHSGGNGWHPHIHAVMWFPSHAAADTAEAEYRAMWESVVGDVVVWGWERMRDGVEDPDEKCAAYASKGGTSGFADAALEATSGQRHASSVWRWLDLIGNTGDPPEGAIYLWETYAKGMKGRRALGKTNAKWLEEVAVNEDEEVSEDVEDEDTELTVELPGSWLAWLWRWSLIHTVTSSAASLRTLAWMIAEDEHPVRLTKNMGHSSQELADSIRQGTRYWE